MQFYCGKLGFVVEDTQLKSKRWIRSSGRKGL